MKIIADYHTHTLYSHGKGTIRENVESARKMGLKEIAICDHGPNHLGFGVKKNKFTQIRKEINVLNNEYDDINILMGVEANVIGYDGRIDVDNDIIELLDILLVGFHFGALPYSFKDAYNMFLLNYLGRVSSSIKNRARRLNTDALINAMNKYDIFLITHPGAKVDIDSARLAKVASNTNTALEINASHQQLTVEYLKIAMKENVKFIISSDAHKPEDVGNMKKGIQIAQKAHLNKKRIINAE